MTFDELYADLQKQTTPEEKAATFKLIEARLSLFPNDVNGHRVLGLACYNGLGTPIDYPRAFAALKRAAESRSYHDIFNLALIYSFGLGVDRSIDLAVKYFNDTAVMIDDQQKRKAFNQLKILADTHPDHSEANMSVASFYSRGKNGIEHNYTLSIPYYTKAAKLGNSTANYSLGMLYSKGLGTPTDLVLGCEYYLKAAQLGHGNALKACEELNHPEGWYVMGQYYLSKSDKLEKAKSYFQKAINAQHVKSLIALYQLTSDADQKIELLEKGLLMPQSKCVFEALQAFCKENPNNGSALFLLAKSYNFGYGVTKNEEDAFKLFTRAMELGIPQAYQFVAEYYSIGKGNVKKDPASAMRLFYAAEKQNFPHVFSLHHMQVNVTDETRYELGAVYALRSDYLSALKTFLASQHDERSLCYLGQMYEKGLGVTKDLEKAAHYYLESAKKNGTRPEGSLDAVLHLLKNLLKTDNRLPYVLCCENAWGTPANPQLVISYYEQELKELYKRLLENEFKPQELPEKLIELIKLNDSIIKNELKLLVSLRKEDYDSREGVNEYRFLSNLISALQKIRNCPAQITTILEDKAFLDEVKENKGKYHSAKRLLDFLERHQVIQHYLQQIRLAMTDLKREMTQKKENKEWRKSIGIMWVTGRPDGVKKAEIAIENFENLDDLNLLTAQDTLYKIFAEKKDKKSDRHVSSFCFYNKWNHIYSGLSLHADYAKLRPTEIATTAQLTARLAPVPLTSKAVDALSEGWHNLIEAQPVKPLTYRTTFDFSEVPNPPLAVAPIEGVKETNTNVPSIYPKKDEDLTWMLSFLNAPKEEPVAAPKNTRALVLA